MCFIEGNVLTVFLSYNSDDYNYLEIDCVCILATVMFMMGVPRFFLSRGNRMFYHASYEICGDG